LIAEFDSPSHRTTKSPILAAVSLALLALAGCTHPTSPSPAPATIDVLSYLLGDAALWPRVGSQGQNQIVDLSRREVCWVKYGNSRRFECWRWDDQFIYHEVDHALDGDSNESYSFTDGRWLPRYLPANATASASWSLDVARNQIVWFDATCHVDPARSHAFPYRQRAWVEPRLDAGSDLGLRDTLVLEYTPYDPAAQSGTTGAVEHFYLGLGAGWYEWERSGVLDFFNRLGGPATPMAREVWCAAP
jgi:hypothetical protein